MDIEEIDSTCDDVVVYAATIPFVIDRLRMHVIAQEDSYFNKMFVAY
jgi:hypothetical protein